MNKGLIASMMICLMLSGCAQMDSITKVAASVAASTGVITQSQADSISKTSGAIAKSAEDITPEQEYYIGRTIGAVIIGKYPPYQNQKVNRYLNLLGQTLAQASDRPETFGGYHFLVLDSDEINAFAAPGGLIFITRGLLRCCPNEDAVAAVLAHEISHVLLSHGLQAISKSRITTALTTIGVESAKTFTKSEISQLASVFEDSISDITQTLVNSGYSRSFEKDADKGAVQILQRVGYNPNALVEMLQVMQTRLKPGGADFAKTHPSPKDRIEAIQGNIGEYRAVETPSARQARFSAALGDI